MFTFNYTSKYVDLPSTALDAVYYNSCYMSLVIVTNDDYVYLYKNVPFGEFSALVNSNSIGNYYATHIKKNYGPSEYLGLVNHVGFEYDPYGRKNGAVTSEVTSSVSAGENVLPNGGDVLSTGTFNRNVTNVSVPKNRYTVAFEHDGKVREHNLEASSMDEAIVAVQNIAEMLDLSFKIKSVTVYFD